MKRMKSGFTLVEIMIVVAIIGLLAAIAIPSFVKARTTARQNSCINNLRQIDSAKEQWALANNKSDTEEVAAGSDAETEIYAYIKGPVPKCPSGDADYVVNNIGTNPECGNDVAGHELPAVE